MPAVEATLRDRTGRGWDEWNAILDARGGTGMSHSEMATWLRSQYPDVSGWWIQTIVVGYERARGLRVKHETTAGFNGSVSKTFPVSADRLFSAWTSGDDRSRWLPGDPLEITTARPSKVIRGKWNDGSRLVVGFVTKGDLKTQLTVDHMKLSSAEDVVAKKAYWKERLGALERILGRPR